MLQWQKENSFNALPAVGALMTLIDFTLSNARRFYSSMENPLAVKELRTGPSTVRVRAIT